LPVVDDSKKATVIPQPFFSPQQHPQSIPSRIMSHPVFITQEENLQPMGNESRDKEGFPQLPISSAARAFCELTAPTSKGDIKVKAHYRRRVPFKIIKVKKPKQCTLQRWFSSSTPPKQPAGLGSNRRQSTKKNPHQESTTNTEKEDRSFAISLHIKEMRDVLAASKINNSPPF
jgi:hypothetical protein